MGKSKTTPASIRQVILSSQALQNINEITGYIAFVDQAPANAIKVGDAIFTCFERIQKNPFAFKECGELATKSKIYRRAMCYSWQIIFKITDAEIIILGIIHAARRPSSVKRLKNRK